MKVISGISPSTTSLPAVLNDLFHRYARELFSSNLKPRSVTSSTGNFGNDLFDATFARKLAVYIRAKLNFALGIGALSPSMMFCAGYQSMVPTHVLIHFTGILPYRPGLTSM